MLGSARATLGQSANIRVTRRRSVLPRPSSAAPETRRPGDHHKQRSEALTRGRSISARGHRVVELLPFDFVVWTEDFANHAERITRYAKTNFPESPREVWLTGKLSERTRRELRKLGWTLHEQTLRTDPRAA